MLQQNQQTPNMADSAGIKHPDTISEMVANRSKAAVLLNC
jgi:hypothetical protein